MDSQVNFDNKDKDNLASDTVKSEDLDENLNRTTILMQDSSPSESNNLIPNQILKSQKTTIFQRSNV